MELSKNPILNIIHFNDVYDIEPENNKGGVARFYNALQKYNQENPLIFFSGDVFNPSHLSNIYFGKQMIEPMNKFKITASCFGNHDFDFELDEIIKLKNSTNFPWIMSNVFYRPTLKPLGEGIEYLIVEKNNMKIGLIGLAEPEWLGLLISPDEKELIYVDFVETAKKYCKMFKESKCEMIIALTHMRTYNDDKLAQEVPEIDLILGGHDHIIYMKQIGETFILKSGCNFNDFSFVTLDFSKSCSNSKVTLTNKYEFKKYDLYVEKVDVNSGFEEDPELKKYVNYYMQETEKEMEKTRAYSEIPLDTRFSIVRRQETEICNFFADLMKGRYGTHVAILNNGTMRSDCIFEAGKLTYRMVTKMLPFFDTVCVLEITGKSLIEALENGVSKYPSYDGRFPSVSGISFTFDASFPAYQRILKESIKMEKEEFKEENVYKVAVKGFIADGKDGYDVLKKCKVIVDKENAVMIQDITNEFFNLPKSHFLDGNHHNHEVKHELYIERWKKLIHSIKKDEDGQFIVIKPSIEGRIKIIGV